MHSLLSGGIAKEFFEKSRLPVAELSKIWLVSYNSDLFVKMYILSLMCDTTELFALLLYISW